MSFDRESYLYRSLPISNNTATRSQQKTVNFNMPQPYQQQSASQSQKSTGTKISIPINNLASSSSTSVSNNHVTVPSTITTNTPAINTEEFAKLDALLEDLLAEVEQPILLNKDGTVTNWNTKKANSYKDANLSNKENLRVNSSSNSKLSSRTDEIERSVDWLNEQKERLRTRKELVNNASSKFSANLATKLSDQNLSLNGDQDQSTNQNYRKNKSKLDYYVSNSNNNNNNNNHQQTSCKEANNRQSSSYNQVSKYNLTYADNSKLGLNKIDQTDNLILSADETASNVTTDETTKKYDVMQPSQYVINNKPPVSPNNRGVYTPTIPQQNSTRYDSFRPLSTNPTSLTNNKNVNFLKIFFLFLKFFNNLQSFKRHMNETDDENYIIDSEFDRYSQRSLRSNASTVQRSKYHIVSNDFIDCTRPAAPTPIPTAYSNRNSLRKHVYI